MNLMVRILLFSHTLHPTYPSIDVHVDKTPLMAHWLYTMDVRLKSPSTIQRAASLGVLCAMKDTPTAAIAVVLRLPSLNTFIKREAGMVAYSWRYHQASKHSRIVEGL